MLEIGIGAYYLLLRVSFDWAATLYVWISRTLYPITMRPRVRHLVGLIHLRAKRFGDAAAALEAAVRLAPTHAGMRMDLSQGYEANGDLGRAAATLDRLLASSPGNLVALRLLNTLLGRMESSAS